jgi:hypothetical protein
MKVEDLPPDSEIGKLFDRWANYLDDRPTRVDLERLQREANELELWLKKARIGSCTEQDFLQRWARSELLKRTIGETEKLVRERGQDERRRKEKLDETYRRYCLLVRALQSGDFENRPGEAERRYKELLSLSASPAELQQPAKSRFANPNSMRG